MEYNSQFPFYLSKEWKKVLNVMKISFFLLFITIAQLYATSTYSQEARLSINNSKISLPELFSAIERQSQFLFFYVDKDVENIHVNINATDKPVTDVLDQALKNTSLAYTINDRHVTISHKTETKAQQQTVNTITGTVIDELGEPAIGVNVSIKNTTRGTMTDLDGKYTLEANPDETIVFSFIGYKAQEVKVGINKIINITMIEDVLLMDEIVVVGYGTMKKRDLTGSVSQVKGDDLKNLPVRSASDALQGKSAGVMVTSTGGSPGTAPAVRIRGIGTVNNNDPLYVVDGLPQSSIGWLNPNDIESIDILKDASATAIYGSRGANGVIMITTAKGSGAGEALQTQVDFDAYFGIQNPSKVYDMMNASQFIDYKNLAYTNAGLDPFYTVDQKQQVLQFLKTNTGSESGTDWWKEINNKNAPVQNYNVSISGGTNNLSYLTSLSYMDQEGIIKGSDYDRISWRTTFDHNVKKWLKLSGNIGIIHESRRNVVEGSPGFNTAFIAFAADPISPVYRTGLKDIPSFLEPSFFMDKIDPNNPYSWYGPILLTNKENPVAQTAIRKDNVWKGITVKGGLSAEFSILPYLKYKTYMAVDLSRGDSDGFTPQYYLDGDQYANDATVSKWEGNSDYWLWENTITFDNTYGDHHILAMAGTSAEETKYEEFGASKQGLVNNNENQRILNAATKNPGASGYKSESAMNSYFGRVFYAYQDKYMITGNIRYDGSSNFGSGEKWGLFPSFSLGWNFINENFMEPFKSWLSNGKLRASYGEIGNQNIAGGAYLTTYSGNMGWYLYGNDFHSQLTGGKNYMGNSLVSWETTRQIDIGADLSFFNGKLNLVVDWFEKKTDGMLLQVGLPNYLGFTNNPWVNAGNVKNTGWEIEIKHRNTVGDFNYNVGVNLFTFKNKVISLGGGEPLFGGTWISYNTTKTEVGKSIGYFYGLKTDGIFQSQAEVDAYFQEGARPGDLRYVDINGDKKIDANDRTDIGNPFPDLSYGLNLGAEYKGFDLQLLFQGTIGNDIMNIQKIDMKSGVGWYNAPEELLTEAWSPSNPSNKQFRISSDNATNLQVSDWLVEDGSYIRLKNIQLGYSLPNRMLEKASVKRVRCWIGAYNLFTATKYSGLDPEIGSSVPLSNGVDQGYYPQAVSYMIGVNATF